jgi:hypothetical protein
VSTRDRTPCTGHCQGLRAALEVRRRRFGLFLYALRFIKGLAEVQRLDAVVAVFRIVTESS